MLRLHFFARVKSPGEWSRVGRYSPFFLHPFLNRCIKCIVFFLLFFNKAYGRTELDIDALPREIFSGYRDRFHVQGISIDQERGCIYMSFTTELLKFDLQGNLIGSVTGITGHLGCIVLNPDDGLLYGSLEYKNDAIGSGILKGLGIAKSNPETAFYIAIFNPDSIRKCGMEASEMMKTVYIKEAVLDYNSQVNQNGRVVDHRFGCSGIDGVAVAPGVGKNRGRNHLYVAYGIYSDESRNDNDYQVLLCYDVSRWKKFSFPLFAEEPHRNGPMKPNAKYFVRTGNTTWGIQNLAYDPYNNALLAAVYAGKKGDWPNYTLFAIDISKPAKKEKLEGVEPEQKFPVLPLLPLGAHSEQKNIWGWHFPWGSTGLCPLGNGYYYISHNSKHKENRKESSTVVLYRWNGIEPFERVK